MGAFISALLQSIFTGSVMFTKSLALVSRVEGERTCDRGARIKGPSCPVPSCRLSWKGGLVWYGVVGLGNKERKGKERKRKEKKGKERKRKEKKGKERKRKERGLGIFP
jgi:hypothetical protein